MKFITGFEGTYIFPCDADVLETTEHATRYPQDLVRLKTDGIEAFRCCIPWHRIEAVEGAYDWAWTDRYLGQVRALGLDPIVDPLHHTSFPAWLEGGFADRRFQSSYLAFLKAFAQRYPWVKRYTIINEPLVTAWFCGHCAIWQPRLSGHENFVPMIVTVCRTISEASFMLDALVDGFEFVHVDSCERHLALDEEALAHAWFENERRFLVIDLILGRLDARHPLHGYLIDNGADPAALAWFVDHPARIDVLGLDYYSHSELAWRAGPERALAHAVQGFAQTALEYARRYPLPVMLTETNLRGDVTDRISWLKYMVGECERLSEALAAMDVPFLGFCWYPYIDFTDWNSLVREANRSIDPQGVYSLDPSFARQDTELSRVFAALAAGQMTAADIPAYPFSEDALNERWVRNFLPHMDWARVPEDLPKTA